MAALCAIMLAYQANAVAANQIERQQAQLRATQQQLRQKKRDLESAQLRVGDLRRQLLETVVGIKEANNRLSSLGRL